MIGFVVNPASGNGRGARVWAQLEVLLKQREVAYVVVKTQGRGDGVTKTAELLRRTELTAVIAVGGDGTVHETVNGIRSSGGRDCRGRPTPFGCVPAGSGNDYTRSLGIASDPETALEQLLSALETGASPVAADLLLLEAATPAAVNSYGFGLDGTVAAAVNRSAGKRLLNRIGLGKLAYIFTLVRVLATYRPYAATVRIDGGEPRLYRHVWLMTAANAPYFGGGMKICPDANMQDGLANVCIVSGISRLKLLLLFPLVFSGKHVRHTAVTMLSGRSITIAAHSRLEAHADGESIDVSAAADGGTECTIRIEPAAWTMLL